MKRRRLNRGVSPLSILWCCLMHRRFRDGRDHYGRYCRYCGLALPLPIAPTSPRM
jgi:hypothetical protein